MNIDFENFRWLNQPQKFELGLDSLMIETSPNTDLWQRTFYGFQNNNAPAFLTEIDGDFTFRVKTEFSDACHLYDQCGILMYRDSDNWVKVSVEYENDKIARLGSVVTNFGFSDWATCDISSGISEMWYRISRHGQDFYIESSTNGNDFQQMRMLHMHIPFQKIRVGVYACSPLESGFRAVFTDFKFETAIQNLTEIQP